MILAVIPARGGSKGIPRKNIKMIAGKPLIIWTIEAAQRSKFIDRIIVSTEDSEISSISRDAGVEVIDRPVHLATDDASTLSVLQHVISKIDADTVVILQPTSPIRNKDLIDSCIKIFRGSGADSLATGSVCKLREYGSYIGSRRQDRKGFFFDDGNVYIIKRDLIENGDMVGKKIERFETTREENIDLDEPFDFWLAEQVLLHRLKVDPNNI